MYAFLFVCTHDVFVLIWGVSEEREGERSFLLREARLRGRGIHIISGREAKIFTRGRDQPRERWSFISLGLDRGGDGG